MSAILYPAFAVAHVLLLVWGIRLYQQERSRGLLFVMAITAGLVYDNTIIALGRSIGIGNTLVALSVPRFVIHGLLTPLLFLAAFDMARRRGVRQFNASTYKLAVVITILLCVVGLWMSVGAARLQPSCFDGILRYTEHTPESQHCADFDYGGSESTQRGMPPIASIATIILVAIAGFMIGRTTGYWWLLVGALVMFTTAAIPVSRAGLVFSNAGEVVLMTTILFSQQIFQRREATFMPAQTA